MATTVIFLTSGTSWQVPADWNSSNNSIECIGGGVGGLYGGGGGGRRGAAGAQGLIVITYTPQVSHPLVINASLLVLDLI